MAKFSCMKKFRWNQGFSLIVLFGLMTGCQKESDRDSDLEWIQSRQNTHRYAYLTQDDIRDPFLMGVSVIKVDDFLSGALDMVIRPLPVKLKFEAGSRNQGTLQVITDKDNETLLTLRTGVYKGYWEVDFASGGNDLEFNQTLDVVGGIYTASDNRGRWVSQGPPKVLKIMQDRDSVVIDLEHTVKQAMVDESPWGSPRMTTSTPDAGKVVLRVWLKRNVMPEHFSEYRSVGAARDLNMGFFGANFVPDAGQEYQTAIQRFTLPGSGQEETGKITFYLKDFPQKYVETAKKAVMSWNDAFGKNILDVKIADQNIDAGDPRYHVIKWFDGTDKTLRWAGVAKMIVHPVSGKVMSGGVYIQGNTLEKLYDSFHKDSVNLSDRLNGVLGGARFEADHGESPVIPFMTDPEMSVDDYMQGYYLETIAHEVGHVLGLRHNFMASVKATGGQPGYSVMDYSPRNERHKFSGPGIYDKAAIQWAYFGVEPAQSLPFCTDEDVETLWNCNRGDHGDPVSFVLKSLEDSLTALSLAPLAPESGDFFGPLKGVAETAAKIWGLKDQLDATRKNYFERALPRLVLSIEQAEPSEDLNEEDRLEASINLNKIKELMDPVLQLSLGDR